MHQRYLDSIKSFEGFTAQAKWDYAQHSNGFGTRARFAGEAIDRPEAERRFAAEIAAAQAFVERQAAGWDEGTKAALTSLTFNAGTRWAASGLGDAVRSGDISAVRERFLCYTKAGGEELPGLVRRRTAEAAWIGTGDLPASSPPNLADPAALPVSTIVSTSAEPDDRSQLIPAPSRGNSRTTAPISAWLSPTLPAEVLALLAIHLSEILAPSSHDRDRD